VKKITNKLREYKGGLKMSRNEKIIENVNAIMVVEKASKVKNKSR
jgi:hypothetical protein